MSKKEESDIKFSEKFSLKIRQTVIVSKLFTWLIVLVLIAAFVGLNLWIQTMDLPEIDVTANKIYSLSDASKEALKDIQQDIKIYVFGIEESDSVVGLIKQYCNVNEHITYEILTKDTNLAKIQEYELEDGYSIVVIESGDSKKIIDTSAEFHSYDYTTYAEIDTTEQTLTNAILGLVVENKPKVYFSTGHGEFGIAGEQSSAQPELGVLTTYLNNEAVECESVNLMSAGKVPEDCDTLAIMSPENDFSENEVQFVIDYINRGGNLFVTSDVLNKEAQSPNFQKILDVYGVSIENGYVLETDKNRAVANYPYIFRPQLSSSNSITADIYSDSEMLVAYAEKLNFASTEELENLHVTYEELMGTSDNAVYITDFSANIEAAASTAQSGHCTIAALLTKTISESTTDETTGETKDAVASKMVICGNGRFITDYIVTEVSSQYPLSYFGSNKDFAINAISTLANKKVGLTLRKDMAGASYKFTATANQNKIVLAIIFSIPVVIILIGIVVWKYRKKRK